MPTPLLQLSDISLTWGGDSLFSDLDLVIQPSDRIALVGRNGSGKSTLLKVMAGDIEPDRGTRVLAPGVTVARLPQEPDMAGFATLGAYAARDLAPSETWRVEAAAEGIGVDLSLDPATASGGEKRRASLAGLVASDASLLLIDEPTNHLDIRASLWLENWLAETRSAFVLISHDRAFLTRLTRATLWLDRGRVRRQDKGFPAFEEWRDKTWAEEDLARHKLDRKIKAEARWALQRMRAARSDDVRRQGTAALELADAPRSGRRVIEAIGISKAIGGKTLFRNLDLKIARGDRVAFVGPNGAGKTTLLRTLTGDLPADAGTVSLGTGLDVAVFDQEREALDPDASLWEALTGDRDMRVSGRADQVMVRGAPRHVVGYLKDFLFDETQARAPVRSLSGGERARLLLAKLMAREANLLVLDEPTNDLDSETLDLLQEVLDDYAGTVLLVSHDRDFIDRVATQTVVMEGDGKVTIFAGGWSDVKVDWESTNMARARSGGASARSPGKAPQVWKEKPVGLTFTERHRLEALPGEIARLEREIAKLGTLLADPELFTREPKKFETASKVLADRQAKLDAAEEAWLELAEKAES